MKFCFCILFTLLFVIRVTGNEADSLKQILKNTANTEQKIKLLFKLSDFYEFSEPATSKLYLKEALAFSQTGFKKEKSFTYRRLEAMSYYYMGVLERQTSNYKAALDNYSQSMQIYDAIITTFPDSASKANTDKANVLNAIGNLHFFNKNHSQALIYLNQALKEYIAQKDTLKMAGTLMNIGANLEHTQKPDEALNHYLRSLELYKIKKHKRLTAVCLNNLGNIYKQQHKYNLADSVYNLSLIARTEINDIKGVSVVLNNLSELRLLNGKYNETIALGLQSLEKAKIVGNLETMRHAYENISKAYALTGKYKEAYESQLSLWQINDTILGIDKQKALLEYQQKYEALEKVKENVTLRENILRRKFYVTLIISLAVALMAVLLWLLYASRLKNKTLRQKQNLLAKEQQLSELKLQQQKETMELRNKELSSVTLQIIQKNQTFNQLKNRLEELRKKSDTAELKEIIRTIDANLQLDDEWQRFKFHFESVNNQFFERLMQKYPDLTPHEVKLCVYLKIGLSSKEISQMLNTSVDAVNKARQRLRKKLNLESETDLATHFQVF